MEHTLILTLMVDEKSQQAFDLLRTLYFPREINYLNAHLTLFHKLPATDLVYESIYSLAEIQNPFSMEVTAVSSIGNGVASIN